MDIIVMNLDGSIQYIDVALVSPVVANAAHLTGASMKNGYAARRAEAYKRTRYPIGNMIPFVIELGGRPGQAARRFIANLYAEEDVDRSKLIAQAWSTLSSVLQSAIAGQL